MNSIVRNLWLWSSKQTEIRLKVCAANSNVVVDRSQRGGKKTRLSVWVEIVTVNANHYLLARAGFLSCFCSTRIVPLNFYPLYLGVIAEEKFEARYLFSTGIQGRKVNILGYLSLSKKPFFCQKLEICLSWNFSSCSTAVESTRNNVFNVSQTFIRAMPNKVLEVEALSQSWKTPSKNVKEVKS